MIAVAIFDCSAEDDCEISFKAKEVIENVHPSMDEEEKGWFIGTVRGITGLFPGNYVKFEEDPITMTADVQALTQNKEVVKTKPIPPKPFAKPDLLSIDQTRSGFTKKPPPPRPTSAQPRSTNQQIPQRPQYIPDQSPLSTRPIAPSQSSKPSSAYPARPKNYEPRREETGLDIGRVSLTQTTPGNGGSVVERNGRMSPPMRPKSYEHRLVTNPNAQNTQNGYMAQTGFNGLAGSERVGNPSLPIRPQTFGTKPNVAATQPPAPKPYTYTSKPYIYESTPVVSDTRTYTTPHSAPILQMMEMDTLAPPTIPTASTKPLLKSRPMTIQRPVPLPPRAAKEMASRYQKLFEESDTAHKGVLAAAVVRAIWTRSQIDDIALGRIWYGEWDLFRDVVVKGGVRDGLEIEEFCRGMYMIDELLKVE